MSPLLDHCVLHVSDWDRADAFYAEGPVERAGAGGTGVSDYFRDPDGALLEFISYAREESRRAPAGRRRES